MRVYKDDYYGADVDGNRGVTSIEYELDEYLKRPEKSHLDYGSEKWLWDFLLRIYKVLKK